MNRAGAGGQVTATGGAGGNSAQGGSGGGPGIEPGAGGSSGSGGAVAIDAAVDAPEPDLAPPDLRPADEAPPDLQPLDVAAPDVAPPPPDLAPGVNLNMGLISRFKLDEGMGTAAADSGPAGNNAMVQGSTWVMPGTPSAKYPNPAALRFDGNNDVVVVPNRMMPANNAPQTVAFFMNYTAAPTGAQVCVSLTQSSSESRLKLGFNDNQVRAWKSSSDPLVATAIPPPGWHHFAYTYDGMRNRLYIDGTERATTTTDTNNGPAAEVRLGGIYNNAENFAGELDDVRFYNRPLSAAEVRALALGAQ